MSRKNFAPKKRLERAKRDAKKGQKMVKGSNKRLKKSFKTALTP
jgi:hypothetical protein